MNKISEKENVKSTKIEIMNKLYMEMEQKNNFLKSIYKMQKMSYKDNMIVPWESTKEYYALRKHNS